MAVLVLNIRNIYLGLRGIKYIQLYTLQLQLWEIYSLDMTWILFEQKKTKKRILHIIYHFYENYIQKKTQCPRLLNMIIDFDYTSVKVLYAIYVSHGNELIFFFEKIYQTKMLVINARHISHCMYHFVLHTYHIITSTTETEWCLRKMSMNKNFKLYSWSLRNMQMEYWLELKCTQMYTIEKMAMYHIPNESQRFIQIIIFGFACNGYIGVIERCYT